MRFFWFLTLSLGAVAVTPFRLPAQESLGRNTVSSTMVDRIFDATRQDAITMLRELYEANQLLVLGERGHDEKPMYAVLNALLQQIGHESRLRYIVVERPSLEAPLYEALSVTNIDEAGLKKILPPSLQRTFCLSPEAPQAASMAAYNLTEFLPTIRRLNAGRPTSRPIQVTTVDGWVLDDGTTREERTSREFAQRIWTRLAPSEKAIVLYHAAHVGKTSANNWFRRFLRQHPDAAFQAAVVMVDWPITRDSGYHEFSNRQAARYPTQPWGVRLGAFRSLVTEEWAWTGSAPEAFDAVVWWPNNIEKVRSTKSYLPIICNSNSRVSDSMKQGALDPVARLFSDVLEGPASTPKKMSGKSDWETKRVLVVRDSLRRFLDTTSLIRNWTDRVVDSLRQLRRSGARP